MNGTALYVMPTVFPVLSSGQITHVGSFQHVDINVQRHLQNVTKTENHMSGLQVRILGIPSQGAKSRVETQIKICLQLVTCTGEKASSWSHLQLPEHLIAKEKLKASGKKEFLNIPKKDIIHLSVNVICASDPSKKVSTCFGCVQRERKRIQKRKETSQKSETDPTSQVVPDLSSDNIQIEQQRIVIFNSSELVDFSSGDIILPTRLTCYCRHHDEKVGFCLQFLLSDYMGNLVSTGVTPPIMITDDHKSSKSKGVKRPRTDSTPIPLSSTPLQDEIINPIPCSTQMPIYQEQTPTSQTSPQYSESNEKFELFDLDIESALSPSELLSDSFRPPTEVAEISRVVPASGPLRGGIEVTVLGSGFYNGVKVMFGENESSTHFWSPTTLICILPPSTTPGFVPVTVKNEIDMSRVSSPHSLPTPSSSSADIANPTNPNCQQNPNVKNEYDFVENILNPEAVMFNYQEDTDRALLELALQIVGLKLTGRVEDSKRIAMAILNNAGAHNSPPNGTPMETHVTQTLQKLLDYPSNFEFSYSLSNETQHTLLHFSVILNYTNLCSFLVNHGVELERKDINGMTPLHFACWMGRVEIARMLIEAGANVESTNMFGQTPKDVTAPINKGIWELPIAPPSPPAAIQQPIRPPTAMDMFIRGSQQFFMNHPFKQSKSQVPSPQSLDSSTEIRSKVEKVRRRKRDRMIFNFWLPLFIVVVALASLQYGLITQERMAFMREVSGIDFTSVTVN